MAVLLSKGDQTEAILDAKCSRASFVHGKAVIAGAAHDDFDFLITPTRVPPPHAW